MSCQLFIFIEKCNYLAYLDHIQVNTRRPVLKKRLSIR